MKKALWLGLLVAAIFLIQIGTASSTSAGSGGAASELLPNLIPLPVDEVRFQTVGEKTFLRFSVTSWNNGLGPLELVARDTASNNPKVYHRVYRDDGGYDDHLAGSFVFYDHTATSTLKTTPSIR